MQISAKIDYACRALLELSHHWPNQAPIQVNTIARKQRIPTKFLVHILIHLKQLGYVESSRGKMGGYTLVKSPQEIKLSDVLKSFGGSSLAKPKDRKNRSPILDSLWQEIDEALIKHLSQISMETICDRECSKGKVSMYDI